MYLTCATNARCTTNHLWQPQNKQTNNIFIKYRCKTVANYFVSLFHGFRFFSFFHFAVKKNRMSNMLINLCKICKHEINTIFTIYNCYVMLFLLEVFEIKKYLTTKKKIIIKDGF